MCKRVRQKTQKKTENNQKLNLTFELVQKGLNGPQEDGGNDEQNWIRKPNSISFL